MKKIYIKFKFFDQPVNFMLTRGIEFTTNEHIIGIDSNEYPEFKDITNSGLLILYPQPQQAIKWCGQLSKEQEKYVLYCSSNSIAFPGNQIEYYSTLA